MYESLQRGTGVPLDEVTLMEWSELSKRASICSLVDVLRLRAAIQPNRVAYRFLRDGEEEAGAITYGELDRRARAVAAEMQRVSSLGEVALVVEPPGLNYITAFLGCLYAGIVAVPLYASRKSGNARIDAVARDARPDVVLGDSETLFAAEKAVNAVVGRTVQCIDTARVSAEWAEHWMAPDLTASSVAFLQYTSGSTAAPKGVVVSHGNILHNQALMQRAFETDAGAVVVSWLPLYHDMGLIGSVLQPLYAGVPCVLMSPVAFLQRPARWLEAISRYGGTMSGGPNFAYDLCIRKITPGQRATLDLSSWRVAFNGAEPVRADTLDQFAREFSPAGFRREGLRPCYGLAEATLFVCGADRQGARAFHFSTAGLLEGRADAVSKLAPNSEEAEARPLVSCGPIPADQDIRIVNPGSLDPCAPGEIGEIWIHGISVAQGYWKRPQESRDVFQAHMSGDSRPFLRTGDLGFVRDGELFVTGRLKDLLIIRGQNHYPQDIERTVECCDDALKPGSGAAFSVEIDGHERLAIVQEVTKREDMDWDGLVRRIREAIAMHHELTPCAITLIRANTIPKTSSGKIRRKACEAAFLRGDLHVLYEWTEQDPKAAGVSPDDPAPMPSAGQESAALRWLASEIARRIGTPESAVDITKPFTAYGLDSLAAVEIAHGMQEALGLNVSAADLFESSCIAELARRVEASSSVVDRRSPAAAENYPLSPGQRALWFVQQMAPESTAYNIARAIRIRSLLEIPALRQAFDDLVDRHAALRTVVVKLGDEPVQRLRSGQTTVFEFADASSWSDSELQSTLLAETRRPFNLEEGPLLRARLYRRQETDYILHVAVHHIVTDFWSLMVLLHELGICYEARRTNRVVLLPALRFGHSDFVEWQKEQLASTEGERLWSYWKGKLSGELIPLNLPTDLPRPQVQAFRGDSLPFRIDGRALRELKEIGAAQQATVFTTLLAAFQSFLHRLSGQERIFVGSPAAGRQRAEFSQIVGYFVNVLPLEADFSCDLNFAEFLAQVRQTVLGALAHEAYPFPLMVENLEMPRRSNVSPIFQTMFVLHNGLPQYPPGFVQFAVGEPGVRMRIGELEIEPCPLPEQTAQFDLVLTLAEGKDGLTGIWQYNSDLFAPATIARWSAGFERLIEAIVSAPENAISQFPIVSETERRELLLELNPAVLDYGDGLCLHQQIEREAALHPDQPAIVYGDSEISYGELDRTADQIARYLRGLGVERQDVVGVCTERTPYTVAIMLGIWKAGAAYVPLDPRYPADRLRFMLADSGARLVLTHEHLRSRLEGTAAAVVCVNRDGEAMRGECAEALDGESPADGATAYIIYTSGSTGVPKGVMLSHRGAMSFVRWVRETFTAKELAGVLASTSICFDLSIFELWGTLCNGGLMILAEDILQWWENERDGKIRSRVTLVNTVPSAMVNLLQRGPLPESVETVNLAGEALTPALVKQIYASGTVRRVNNLYGPTETTTYSSWTRVTADEKVTIGRGLRNTWLYVLNPSLQLQPRGVIGELYIGGVGLAQGYWKRPELTAERFIPHPFSSIAGERMYRTGDLARWNDSGLLEYLGRADHQVKLRGFRIELEEIAAVLSACTGVRESAVVVKSPGGEPELVAYVALQAGAEPRLAEIGAFLRERLPSYMVPARIIRLENLPKTPNGKIDRKALPELQWEQAAGEGPQSPLEEIVAAIWAEVLSRKGVSTNVDFFEAGGHSLLATKVVARLEQRFQIEIPLRHLFESPTVAAMARRIEERLEQQKPCPSPPLRRCSNGEPRVLSFAQQRIWLLEKLRPGTSAYNIPFVIHVNGTLDRIVAQQAIHEILRRHESLRTIFPSLNGLPVPRVLELDRIDLPFASVCGLPREESEAELRKIEAAICGACFALETGPLFRFHLVQAGPEAHSLYVAVHHAVADGSSVEILTEEFGLLYEALKGGERAPVLNDLPIQYTDFAIWERSPSQLECVNGDLAYWGKQLHGHSALLELPTDRPRGGASSLQAGLRTFSVPESTRRKLTQLGGQHGSTTFMVLVAALQLFLSRFSGQEDICVGTAASNRRCAETEQLIGLFVNTLVLRADVQRRASFSTLLEQVRETTLSAFAHQSVPFERLVEELQPDRSLTHSPFFQVLFAFQHDLLREMEAGHLKLRPCLLDNGASKFDLTVLMAEDDNGLSGGWQYSRDLFDDATIERWVNSFLVLLNNALEEPDRELGSLALMGEPDRLHILAMSRGPETPFDCEHGLHEAIEAQAIRAPEQTALVSADGKISYRELNARANQVARYLMQIGCGPESLVGICMKRSPRMVAAMLGVWKCGAAYVPLDPKYPSDRLRVMLELSRTTVVLTEEETSERVQDTGARLMLIDRLETDINTQSACNLQKSVHGSQIAYLIFTSGSTGVPKGVMLEHRNAASLVSWAWKTFDPAEMTGVLASTSICFDLSIFELWVTLSLGGTVILVEDVLAWLESARQGTLAAETSLVNTVPSAMQQLVERGGIPRDVGTVNLAGEALSKRLVNAVYDASNIQRVNNLYGPTETTTYSSWSSVPAGTEVSIGTPLCNTQLYVLDSEFELAPIGVTGELYIGGAGVARGYWARPDLTAERFVPDPFSGRPGERIYRTGDLVRWRRDGQLEYLGRADQQVKVRGYRIELGEISSVLNGCEDVLEAVAVAIRGAGDRQDDDRQIVAYAAPKAGMALRPETLKAHVAQRLPAYMVPSHIVVLDALPKTPNGKLDRKALPEPERTAVAGRMPQTEIEKEIAQIWAEVLKLERVGAEENFFVLGGHSLMAAQIMARVESRFQTAVPLSTLFESPTVAAMARAIESGKTKPILPKVKRIARVSRRPQERSAEAVGVGESSS